MISGIVMLSWLAVQQPATVTPSTVDARGAQQVVVRVAQTGMYRVQVDSAVGTSCELADHLRGPFVTSGSVGTKSCDTTQLLEAGLYKMRLQSPGNGKGKATVRVTPFANASEPMLVDDGRTWTTRVRNGEQALAWIRIDRAREVHLEVAGRTAGRVALWRDGEWSEAFTSSLEIRPRAGRPLHRWSFTGELAPGLYALAVYGVDAKVWTDGPDDDTVVIAHGDRPLDAAGSLALTLPASGYVMMRAPGPVAAFLGVDAVGKDAYAMTSFGASKDERLGIKRAAINGACEITREMAVPSCAVLDANGPATFVLISGVPGSTVQFAWAPLGRGGFVSAGEATTFTAPASTMTTLSLAALPGGIDAVPVGCKLESVVNGERHVIATDLPHVSWTQAWRRSFNYDATSTAVWLAIDKPGLYAIQSDDKTGATCEVYRLDDDKLAGGSREGSCDARLALGAGNYEVRFYGGKPGIKSLRVGQVGLSLIGSDVDAPARAGCLLPDVRLAKDATYRLVTNAVAGAALRAFATRDRALAAGESIVLPVDPGRETAVLLDAGSAVVVRAATRGALECALGGVTLPTVSSGCTSGDLATAATLVLRNPGARPMSVFVSRPRPVVESPLASFRPPPSTVPLIRVDAPAWFDLDRAQMKPFVLEVTDPGLYRVETDGLLATRCVVRTPTTAELVAGDANGRGRNCLVSAYLKPGRYLVTVAAQGESRGRAGLRVARAAPQRIGTLAVDDESFFRVEAGVLAQQAIDVKKATSVTLSTSSQGAALQCRLEDDDGWPLVAVPTACELSRTLEPGRYLWTQMPITVESRRRTAVAIAHTDAVPLTGDKPHTLVVNAPTRAVLGPDGHDEFTFAIDADLDVGIVLGNAMQGRLYRVVDEHNNEIVEQILPQGGPTLGADEGVTASDSGEGDGGEGGGCEGCEGGTEGGYDDSGDAGEYGEYREEESDGSEGGSVGREGVASAAEQEASSRAMSNATVASELPSLPGQVVPLRAGRYLLQTEHSRGDTAVAYDVGVAVRQLAPGVRFARVPVPGRVTLQMPAARAAAGMLRVKTRGDVDVRCRLFDATGRLVGESADSGADWNCALAMPLSAGVYSLALEAEALQPGQTELSAVFLEGKDTGELADGASFKVVGKVASSLLPIGGDGVQDVMFTSEQDFSCAVEDDHGVVLDRRVGVRRCNFLLWPGPERRRFRVSVWTADRPASVQASLRTRPIRALGGIGGLRGNLDDKSVGRERIAARGRYETAPNALCVAAAHGGLLMPCPVAYSGDPAVDGPELLVGVARGETAHAPLGELITDVASPARDARMLQARHATERLRSRGEALHLVDVRAPRGSSSAPSCALDGGVRVRDASRCAAAVGPTRDAMLSTWTRVGPPLPTTVLRRAVALPASKGSLTAGESDVRTTSESARFALPDEPYRLDMALPAGAWALLLHDGHVSDLCAPSSDERPARLQSCVLRGRGGELVVVAAEGEPGVIARASLLRFAVVDEPPRVLAGVREVRPRDNGRERLTFAPSSTARVLRVEGWGVRACAVHFDNGTHVAGCRADVVAGSGGELVVEHDTRPWRALLHDATAPAQAARALAAGRFGAAPATASTTLLPAGQAIALGAAGSVVERIIDVPQAAVVHVRATGGVCGVFAGSTALHVEGLGAGCDQRLVVDKGRYRVLVRAFGATTLGGTVVWNFEPVITLGEGVGPSVLARPGEARVFRFTLDANGELGVGVQVDADVLRCTLLDAEMNELDEGCQQFATRTRGTYYLRVEVPDDDIPRSFKPVVFGLKGSDVDVPDDYLRDLFRRIRSTEVR